MNWLYLFNNQLSSFLLFRIDSRMRLTSFLPGCSPCFRGTLLATFFHPVASWAVVDYLILFASFSRFSRCLSSFSLYFFSSNSSSNFLPLSFLSCFCWYSTSWINKKIPTFSSVLPGCAVPLLWFFGWLHRLLQLQKIAEIHNSDWPKHWSRSLTASLSWELDSFLLT